VAHLLARTRIRVLRRFEATGRAGCNRQELQQVAINLMVNAIQAMPDGGVLTLATRDMQGPEGRAGVLIEVSDSGPGLAPEVCERLFRPFFTTKNDGNGLGLWISLGLVERYGGSITARNAPAGGAVFTVTLWTEPQVPDAAAARTNNGRPEAASAAR
jgi:two-component system NtrC family sensor kinase